MVESDDKRWPDHRDGFRHWEPEESETPPYKPTYSHTRLIIMGVSTCLGAIAGGAVMYYSPHSSTKEVLTMAGCGGGLALIISGFKLDWFDF